MTHSIYRLFDADGALLYIGVSKQVPTRIAQHRADKTWASEIARVETEEFPTRDDALLAEYFAIDDEDPRYNVLRNEPLALSPAPGVRLCSPRDGRTPRCALVGSGAASPPVAGGGSPAPTSEVA